MLRQTGGDLREEAGFLSIRGNSRAIWRDLKNVRVDQDHPGPRRHEE